MDGMACNISRKLHGPEEGGVVGQENKHSALNLKKIQGKTILTSACETKKKWADFLRFTGSLCIPLQPKDFPFFPLFISLAFQLFPMWAKKTVPKQMFRHSLLREEQHFLWKVFTLFA